MTESVTTTKTGNRIYTKIYLIAGTLDDHTLVDTIQQELQDELNCSRAMLTKFLINTAQPNPVELVLILKVLRKYDASLSVEDLVRIDS